LDDPTLPDGWCNFWRKDDWSSVAYFYLDSPTNGLPAIAAAPARIAGLMPSANAQGRADT
jgi:hypothetical protein